jgi:hypothetical protein
MQNYKMIWRVELPNVRGRFSINSANLLAVMYKARGWGDQNGIRNLH